MTGDRLSQSTEAALAERIKELTCLYGIAQVAAQPGISLEEIIQGIVELLPPAWQYPETAFNSLTQDKLPPILGVDNYLLYGPSNLDHVPGLCQNLARYPDLDL